jgi:hypothetical protein
MAVYVRDVTVPKPDEIVMAWLERAMSIKKH